jgi:organic radical activating enzyme
MNDILRFVGVNKDTRTAGPGRRLEFFTKGCIRGVISPCFGCFNEKTWTFEGLYREATIDEIVEISLRDAWNRQVTFCGGEPILQAKALTKVAKRLKEIDPTFHFVMYASYKLDVLMKYGLKFTWNPKYGEGMLDALNHYSDSYRDFPSGNRQYEILTAEDVQELMKYVDVIVDGDYQQDKRLTSDKYMHDGWFVGSSNQRVINCPESIKTGQFTYVHADVYNEQRLSSKHCKTCGHDLQNESSIFCKSLCADRYSDRKKEVALLGGV